MHFLNPTLVAVVGYTLGIAAHGIVKKIEAGGVSMTGYQPHAWTKVPTPGWSIPKDQDHGFLSPDDYQNPDIICHVGATPGQVSITVAAGESIGLQWTSWPESHHGSVANYLANCRGKCEDVDKTMLEFNKIDDRGLIHSNPHYPIGKYVDDVTTGYWYGDELIKNDNKAWFKVPEWLAAGNYVFRHELMALHSAMEEGPGIQHYPQCINLIVTGDGSDSLESGTRGTDLYRRNQPGVVVNIFRNPGEYTVPGPEVYKPGNVEAAPKKSSAPPAPKKSLVPPAPKKSLVPPAPKKSSAPPAPKKSLVPPAPKKSSAPPAQKSVAPKQKYSFAPLGKSSVAPQKTSAAPERMPVPHVTPSHGGYRNTTITSSLPQKTKVPESNEHGSYKYTDLDGAEQGHGSAPQTGKVLAVGSNGASNSRTGQHESSGESSSESSGTSSGGSSGYDYDLSNDVTSSSDANSGGNTYNTPKGSSPDVNSHVASDVKAEEKHDKATTPALDPYIASLLDLIQKTLDKLRQKVLGGSVHKRHARDLGN